MIIVLAVGLVVVYATACLSGFQMRAGTRSGRPPNQNGESSLYKPIGERSCQEQHNDAYRECGGTCVLLGSPGYANDYSNPQNCGACGHACNDNEVCYRGQCQSCDRGLTVCSIGDCGGTSCPSETTYAFCTNLKDDNGDCGKCGHACPNGYSCIQGHCER